MRVSRRILIHSPPEITPHLALAPAPAATEHHTAPNSSMLGLTQSLALCTVFIFLSISILLFIAVFYICKFHYERIQLEQCAVRMRPEEVSRGTTGKDCEKGEEIFEMELPFYSSTNVPQKMLQSEELPPEYYELESARASPLPSYDDVMYCDQLNRSFQNLLSAR